MQPECFKRFGTESGKGRVYDYGWLYDVSGVYEFTGIAGNLCGFGYPAVVFRGSYIEKIYYVFMDAAIFLFSVSMEDRKPYRILE